jgi:hypothetical protein
MVTFSMVEFSCVGDLLVFFFVPHAAFFFSSGLSPPVSSALAHAHFLPPPFPPALSLIPHWPPAAARLFFAATACTGVMLWLPAELASPRLPPSSSRVAGSAGVGCEFSAPLLSLTLSDVELLALLGQDKKPPPLLHGLKCCACCIACRTPLAFQKPLSAR